MIKIAIPSYRRPDYVKCFKWIPLEYKDNVYLFVRHDEYDSYHKNYGNLCNIISLPEHISAIGETRQHIINYFSKDRIWMIDDDMKLVKLYKDTDKKYLPRCKNTSSIDMFYGCIEYINEILDMQEFSFGHIGMLSFPINPNKYPYVKNVGVNGSGNIFINLEKINKSLFCYDKLKYFEDVLVVLSLYTNGHNFCKITTYAFDSGKPNTPGGCSIDRTIESVNECIDYIHRLYPAYTNVLYRGKTLNIPGNEQLKSLSIKLNSKYNHDNLEF